MNMHIIRKSWNGVQSLNIQARNKFSNFKREYTASDKIKEQLSNRAINKNKYDKNTDRNKLISSAKLQNSILRRGRLRDLPPPDDVRSALSVKALLNAGVHLGHCPENWNKNMLPFIYGERNRIHIINLEHTLTELRRACAFLKHLGSLNGRIIFVGKRPQIHTIIYDAAHLSYSNYMFIWDNTILQMKPSNLSSLPYRLPDSPLFQVVEKLSSPVFNVSDIYSRKHWYSAPEKLNKHGNSPTVKHNPYVEPWIIDAINGHYPDAVIVADYMNCLDVISDCNKALIPVVAICDTDCDPNIVQYVIPGNDDSLSSVSLILSVLALSIKEGSDMRRLSMS